MVDDKQRPMGDTGEEVYDIFSINMKGNRRAYLQGIVDDALDDAIRSMPESDKQELSRRLRKLFVAAFKTPEMDRLVREAVVERASMTAKSAVEAYGPRLDRAIQDELERSWRDIVGGYVKGLLASAVHSLSLVFARKLDEKTKEMIQQGISAVDTAGGETKGGGG